VKDKVSAYVTRAEPHSSSKADRKCENHMIIYLSIHGFNITAGCLTHRHAY